MLFGRKLCSVLIDRNLHPFCHNRILFDSYNALTLKPLTIWRSWVHLTDACLLKVFIGEVSSAKIWL